MKSRVHPIIQVLLLLAVFGFVIKLIKDPVTILVITGMSALLLFLLNNYQKTGRFLPRMNAHKPKQTAKSGKIAVKRAGHTPRKDIPFRVIEGSKGKTNQKKDQQEPKTYH